MSYINATVHLNNDRKLMWSSYTQLTGRTLPTFNCKNLYVNKKTKTSHVHKYLIMCSNFVRC